MALRAGGRAPGNRIPTQALPTLWGGLYRPLHRVEGVRAQRAGVDATIDRSQRESSRITSESQKVPNRYPLDLTSMPLGKGA